MEEKAQELFYQMKQWMKGEIERQVAEEVAHRMETLQAGAQAAFGAFGANVSKDGEGKPDAENQQAPKRDGREIEEISADAKTLFDYLREYRQKHKDDDPEATPSYKEIREGTDLPSNRVTESFKELDAHNIIEREKRGRRKIVRFPERA